jgi:hypothetical protein
VAVAVDASSQAAWVELNGTGAVTSATFSPPATSLIVVAFYDDNTSTTADATASITNTGTALTWTRQVVANQTTTSGTYAQAAVIFWALNAASQSAISVTVTPSGTSQFDSDVTVSVFTGHNTTTPIGASGVGKSATAATAVSYTATVIGSLGYFTISTGQNITSLVAGASTTSIAATKSAGNAASLLAARQTTASSGLTTQTMNSTANAAAVQDFAYVEIVPASAAGSLPKPIILRQAVNRSYTY